VNCIAEKCRRTDAFSTKAFTATANKLNNLYFVTVIKRLSTPILPFNYLEIVLDRQSVLRQIQCSQKV